MASEKQRAAARRNIRKAATAAKKKRTIAHLLFLSLRSTPLGIITSPADVLLPK